jgi:hypothetical protein
VIVQEGKDLTKLGWSYAVHNVKLEGGTCSSFRNLEEKAGAVDSGAGR